jgi:cold shock CspA family protein
MFFMKQQPIIAVDVSGEIASLHPRGFGFITRTLKTNKVRIYFHLADSDGTAFEIGDHVKFDVGWDGQNRPRAYNVRFVAPPTADKAVQS